MGRLPDITADHIGLHPGNQFPDTAASICDQVFPTIFRDGVDDPCHCLNGLFLFTAGNANHSLHQCLVIRLHQVDEHTHTGDYGLV